MKFTDLMTPLFMFKLVVLLLNIAVLLFLWEQKPSANQNALQRVAVSGTILSLGYLVIQVANSSQMVVFGYSIAAVGGTFFAYYTIRFFAVVCNRKLPQAAIVGGLFFAIFNAIDCITAPLHTFYYKAWQVLPADDGTLYIDFVKGPGYYINNYNDILLCIIGILIVYTSTRNFSRKRKAQAVILCIIAVIVPAAYLLEIINDSDFPVPAGLILAELLLVFLVHGAGLYDTDDTIHAEAFRGMDDAIIAFDAKGRYMGANPLALTMFPELGTISFREKITEDQFADLEPLIAGKASEYVVDDRIYEATVKPVEDSKDISALWLRDVTDQRKSENLMKNYQQQLETEVEEKTAQISDMQQKIISGMADIIENRDDNTGGHVKRTSYVVNILTKAMQEDGFPGITPEYIRVISATAPLHDIGKISIPDSVLQKPGRLTDAEYDVMKKHSARGEGMVWRLLHGVEYPEVIEVSGNIARNHHEKWDGSGYPDHLEAGDIPLEARIMAVADVYDALVSKRVYKDPMPFDKAYDIIDSGFGTQFDPSLKKYFDICRKDIEAFYEKER